MDKKKVYPELKFQVIDWRQDHNIVTSEDRSDDSDGNDSLERELEDSNDEELEYSIKIYGKTEDNKSVFVNVEKFTPFFYVKIPSNWNDVKSSSLVSYIKNNISNKKLVKGLVRFDVVTKKDLRGFTAYKDCKFIRFVFKNMKSYKTFENWIDRNKIKNTFLFQNPIKLSLYESNIEPFMRCMHIKKINACGWIKISNYTPYETKYSYCDINIKTHWNNLEADDSNMIQKFVVASYDIECMSESGNFPEAKNDNDPIIQIGTVFSYYGESEPFYKHMISLGGCTKIEALQDVDIECYEKERNVLLGWTRLIQRMNPDIITGYNINGFDFAYMKDRAKKFKVFNEFSKLSRIVDESSEWKEKQLSSSALGDNLLKFFDMNGRIVIDLMKVLQRDAKLDSYKLDSVSAYYIKESIKKVDYNKEKNVSLITTTSVYGIRDDQYLNILFNDGLTDNKLDNKYKIKEINQTEKTISIEGEIPEEVFGEGLAKNKVYWCHAKDDVSPNELFKLFKGSDDDRAKIAKYCIQDCVLVIKLLEKLQVINNNIGMANVCNVPLSYIFMRGQGIKIFSLVSKKCRELNHLIPRLKVKNKQDKDKEDKFFRKRGDSDEEGEGEENVGYEGATVFPPVKGVHYEPIPVLDYASLYPRSMIYRNISHECIVLDPKYDDLEEYIYHTVSYRNNDDTTTTCRFAKKKDGTMGILPLILIELLDKRSATKKLMDKAESSFTKNILDGLQLAYKVTANSLYGQVGAPTSPIYMKELAASTTATGREMLEFSRDFIQGDFGQMINLAIHNREEYLKEAMRVYSTPNALAKKFVNPKAGYNNKEEYIEYFYNKINGVLKKTMKVKPKIIYGDSVPGYVPVLLMKDNISYLVRISELVSDEWIEYDQFKKEDTNLKEKEQIDLEDYNIMSWTDKGWAKIKRIIRHKTYKKIYRIVTTNSIVDVTEDHSLLLPDGTKIKPEECKIGTELLHNTYEKAFEKKDNNKFSEIDKLVYGNICEINQDDYLYLADRFFSKRRFNIIANELEIDSKDTENKIIGIIDLGFIKKDEYVYDLETEVGHFHAGIGSMIVKNTDSVFFSPKIHDIETREIKTDREALIMCIEIGQLAGETICKILPEPEEQVYEKTLWPFIILTKKRYVGNLYETNPDKFYQKSMGIVLKRRDNAKIVKIVVGGIVNKILNERSNQGAIDYTKDVVKKILRNEYPIDKFIISKTLKGNYKDRSRIVHAVLADRIAERDPGNKPDVNDRVPWVYIIPNGKALLQGDRVEDPKYVIENKLEIDYLFYLTNQIMKPSLQFLELIAYHPEKIFTNYINKEINRRKKVLSIFDYVGKKKKKDDEYFSSEEENIDEDSLEKKENIDEENDLERELREYEEKERKESLKNNKLDKETESNKTKKSSLTLEL